MKRNKDIAISIGITLLALGGLAWLARPSPAHQNFAGVGAGQPDSLQAEEAAFDFGTVSMAAGNVSHTFVIRNAAADPITITKLYTSCMCTTGTLEVGGKRFGPYGMPGHGSIPRISEAIGAGEKADVEVVFDPAAHGPAGIGPIERVIYVERENGGPLELTIRAMVRP